MKAQVEKNLHNVFNLHTFPHKIYQTQTHPRIIAKYDPGVEKVNKNHNSKQMMTT